MVIAMLFQDRHGELVLPLDLGVLFLGGGGPVAAEVDQAIVGERVQAQTGVQEDGFEALARYPAEGHREADRDVERVVRVGCSRVFTGLRRCAHF